MGVREIYSCDRCGKEMEERENAKIGEDILSWDIRGEKFKFDRVAIKTADIYADKAVLCTECAVELKDNMKAALLAFERGEAKDAPEDAPDVGLRPRKFDFGQKRWFRDDGDLLLGVITGIAFDRHGDTWYTLYRDPVGTTRTHWVLNENELEEIS